MNIMMGAPREQVIWSDPVTEGFFKKTVVETRQITNRRVIQNATHVGLDLLDDIVVMNQHRVRDSNYYSFGMRGSPRFGTGKSQSRMVGDIAFIYQGKPQIIFRQIPDPQGVVRLAKAARKALIESKKTAEKMKKARLQEQRQQQQQKERISVRATTTTSNNKVITCPRCSSTNVQGSKYCNNCGFRFADAIIAKEEGTTIINQRPPPSSSSVASSPSSSPSLIKTTEQNIGNFVNWVSPTYGVKIKYPSNWRVGKGPTPSSTFVIFQSPKEDPSDILFESVGISSYNVRNEKPEQLMQGVINQVEKKYQDFTLIESVPTILTGRQAYRTVFDAAGKRYMIVITIEKNKAYQIMFVAEPSKYDTYLGIVQNMLDSFEITINR